MLNRKPFILESRAGKEAPAEKPSPDQIKELAARGLSRAEIAKELGISYERIARYISGTDSLLQAFNEGKEIYKNASQQTQKT
jgi:DNA-binding NarL/FixJ family response regulator